MDFPDRFGNVALHDTVIARRLDLVRYLVVKHGANPTIADNYNVTPISVALPGPVCDLLIECKNKEEYKEHKSRCAKCHKVGVDTLRCGKCRVANYCSRDCQVAHWKMHKAQCNAHDATHVIIAPGPLNKTPTSQESWRGKPPVGVAVDAYFDVKIQLCLHQDEAGLPLGPDPEGAYMLYNQARDISMFVADKHCPQRRVLFDLIQGVPECGGLKAYFKAKVTASWQWPRRLCSSRSGSAGSIVYYLRHIRANKKTQRFQTDSILYYNVTDHEQFRTFFITNLRVETVIAPPSNTPRLAEAIIFHHAGGRLDISGCCPRFPGPLPARPPGESPGAPARKTPGSSETHSSPGRQSRP